jgi:replicative DNA helicase
MVLFLHRSGENSSVNVDVERAWLIAGKNRNGPVGKYALGFYGKSTRFVSDTDDDDGARDAQVSGQHWTDS